MTRKLKRCPFCGSAAEYTSIDKEFVRCSKGLQCPSEAAVFAVEDWQTRALEDALMAVLQQIAEVCNKCASTDAKFAEIRAVADKALEMK